MLFSIGLDSVGESPFEDFAESAEQRYRPVGGWVVVVRFPWFFQNDLNQAFNSPNDSNKNSLLNLIVTKGIKWIQHQHNHLHTLFE